MIIGLISLLIYLIIVGVVLWAIDYLAGVVPMPPPLRQVIHVLVIVVAVLVLLYALLGFIGEAPALRLPR